MWGKSLVKEVLWKRGREGWENGDGRWLAGPAWLDASCLGRSEKK